MLNKVKAWWLTKIYEWTEEINHDHFMSILKEILKTSKKETTNEKDL
jgi:hypothetical protein